MRRTGAERWAAAAALRRMSGRLFTPSAIARRLIAVMGRKAPQHVVDEMDRAIRRHDLAEAKNWNTIGCAVDRQLSAAGGDRRDDDVDEDSP